MGYYKHHVFFCTNVREDGRPCCSEHDSAGLRDYAKGRIKALNLNGEGKVRINNAGCMDRCSEGPVIAVYPDNVWYTFVDRADIDEIIDEHLVHDRVVERLKL
ncbi:MAG TPA: (2Fe-2S) ferredoxin domain-containing protein [Usitatibacteraceae bacterium]|nr:(2Fe-2S) ferredoxin domain-containing protein [Usitatibacteraceae bacterium]